MKRRLPHGGASLGKRGKGRSESVTHGIVTSVEHAACIRLVGSCEIIRSSHTQQMHVGSRGKLPSGSRTPSHSSELQLTYWANPSPPGVGSVCGASRCSTQYSVMGERWKDEPGQPMPQ